MQSDLAQKIITTSQDVLTEHGLHDWKVTRGNALSTAGSCQYRSKTIRISLQIAKVAPWEDTYDTILHEVAHALAGHAAGHGYEWRRIARSIGLKNPQRLVHVDTSEIDPWVGTCPNGHVTTRAGAPRRVRSCLKCAPGFNPEYIFTWTKDGEEAKMPRQYLSDLVMIQVMHGQVNA